MPVWFLNVSIGLGSGAVVALVFVSVGGKCLHLARAPQSHFEPDANP
jgi:hypothetical protein